MKLMNRYNKFSMYIIVVLFTVFVFQMIIHKIIESEYSVYLSEVVEIDDKIKSNSLYGDGYNSGVKRYQYFKDAINNIDKEKHHELYKFMESIASILMKNIWITGLKINNSDDQINIFGMTSNSKMVAPYAKQISQVTEINFKNLSLIKNNKTELWNFELSNYYRVYHSTSGNNEKNRLVR